jgi:hypothetical protein
MMRRVGSEAARRLLELALASDGTAAPCLVPGHRHVHEALVEVALSRHGRPPGQLQLLVGLEVAAGPHEVEAPLEVRHGERLLTVNGLSSTALGGYPQRVATILLCGVDLFFRGKLEALLSGHDLITLDSAASPELVIVDIARVDPEEVADTYLEVPILGYTNHTDTAGLRAAHAAGFDQVVAKSTLVERARELVDQLTASVE